jgi:hypothetical protein
VKEFFPFFKEFLASKDVGKIKIFGEKSEEIRG